MCNEVQRDNSQKDNSLIEKWAIWLICLCIVILLFGVGCFVYNKTVLMPKVISLEIAITPDSSSNVPTYSKKEVDSLITVTKTTLEAYEHHFKTETMQKEQEDIYKSFGTLLLSVIIGLGGFFGFKSFKDVKDKGEQMSKEVADNKAKEVAENVAKNASEQYLQSKLPEVVQKQFEESFNDTAIASIRESVKKDLVSEVLQALPSQQESEADKGADYEEGAKPHEETPAPMTPDEMFNKQEKHA